MTDTPSPLVALKSEEILVFHVPKDVKQFDIVNGVKTYSPDNLDILSYRIYLTGSYDNPFEFVSVNASELPLSGYLLQPKHLDSRVASGTVIPGSYQGTTGFYKRVFANKGLPIVADIIGDKVYFLFATKSQRVDYSFTN